MGREERGVKRGFVGMEERGEELIGGSGEERGGREGREESHGGREEERREACTDRLAGTQAGQVLLVSAIGGGIAVPC